MPGKSKRLKLVLTPQEVQHLQLLRASRTAPVREVQRAEILWRYHSGETIAEIMRAVKMTRKSVGKWINRALAIGVEAALKDAYHRPRPPGITADAKAWVVHLACSKPTQLGYAAELWTRSALALHVRRHAVEAGYPALAQAAKATVHRILAEQPLHPEKVKYYLERRDPDFESKMRQVLLVYREVAFQNESLRDGLSPGVITVSVDEKPGVQAIANVAPDLPPKPGRHPCVARDYEYKRLGTCSILAALDLHSGRVTARVERRHRSREFILLLKDLDQFYPVWVAKTRSSIRINKLRPRGRGRRNMLRRRPEIADSTACQHTNVQPKLLILLGDGVLTTHTSSQRERRLGYSNTQA